MIVSDRGQDHTFGPGDHIGGIEPSAQTCFQNNPVTGLLAEIDKGSCCDELELSRVFCPCSNMASTASRTGHNPGKIFRSDFTASFVDCQLV
jgi:hypothetical protein